MKVRATMMASALAIAPIAIVGCAQPAWAAHDKPIFDDCSPFERAWYTLWGEGYRCPPSPGSHPAPPPPPPPPPPPAVTQGPFMIFFDWGRADLTAEAVSVLDNAAGAYAATGQARIELSGHADRSESESHDIGLSQRRADAVKAYLAGRGVPDAAMSAQGYGDSRPLVPTADAVPEPQNRRVEIVITN